MGKRIDRLKKILENALAPESLKFEDESHQHQGHHPELEGEEETHLKIYIKTTKFKNLSRVERSRMVHALLHDEMSAGLHAVSLKLED